MNKNISKILIALSMGLSALTMQGCTSEDVAFGAGLVIGVIISDDHPPAHRQPPRYPGDRHRHGWGVEASSQIQLTPAEKVAARYEISEDAASLILSSLTEVKNGNIEALSQMGLENADLSAMSQGENPSASALIRMSEKLSLELGETHNLIQSLKADIEIAKNQR